jgi:two-component system response regulator HydG
VKETPYDAILMDVRMVRVSGIEALQQIKQYNPAIPIIIMTAYSSVDTAVEAMKLGAYDYLTKPLNFDDLKFTLDRSLEHMALAREIKTLKELVSPDAVLGSIIGNSHVMRDLIVMVKTVSSTEATILISGESGTGKELIARAIHANSLRKDGPLVTVNCAALTDTLLESELFGHEKGAFTGAEKRRDGRFIQAQQGTIFLDEVGEIPLHMQAKLLRAIQEREIQRVGSDATIKVDVRILAATNRDLLADVKEGKFREDLYYRLNVVNLRVPSLAERKEDIPLLAQHFLERFTQKNRKILKGFTPGAMDLLIRYSWPGNVRELENAVERAVIMCVGDYISERELPPILPQQVQADNSDELNLTIMGGMPLDEIEKSAIKKTLEETGGNKSEAARILNITRTTLNNKIKKYDIDINK